MSFQSVTFSHQNILQQGTLLPAALRQPAPFISILSVVMTVAVVIEIIVSRLQYVTHILQVSNNSK